MCKALQTVGEASYIRYREEVLIPASECMGTAIVHIYPMPVLAPKAGFFPLGIWLMCVYNTGNGSTLPMSLFRTHIDT